MDLTDENKRIIDGMSYKTLLSKWRFSPSSDVWFQGETGDYWGQRMKELRNKPVKMTEVKECLICHKHIGPGNDPAVCGDSCLTVFKYEVNFNRMARRIWFQSWLMDRKIYPYR